MLTELKEMAASIREQCEQSMLQLSIVEKMIKSIEEEYDSKWLTTAQASEQFGIPVRSVRHLAETKVIRSRRRGSRNLEVNLADCLQRFSKNHNTGNTL